MFCEIDTFASKSSICMKSDLYCKCKIEYLSRTMSGSRPALHKKIYESTGGVGENKEEKRKINTNPVFYYEIYRNSDVKSDFLKNVITNMALEPRYRIMLDQFFLYQYKVLLKPSLEKSCEAIEEHHRNFAPA